MSNTNPADLPGTIAILGLLVEQPDQTVAEVTEGLKSRFAGSRFDPATAHTGLPRMAKDKRSRPRVHCSHKAPEGRTQDRYRTTRAGAEEFRAWMYAMPTGVPALREALYGRIELCRLEDLPALIRIAREDVSMANDLFTSSKARLSKHLERGRRRHNSQEERSPEDYLQEVRGVLLHVTPEFWSLRSSHYDEIARHLEDIAKRAGIEFEAGR
jgi:DNA-binding PadR family transcriptional regulator